MLVDRKVTYKTIIQVMDRVGSAEIVNVTELETVELFPNISMGDAPELEVAPESVDALDEQSTEVSNQ